MKNLKRKSQFKMFLGTLLVSLLLHPGIGESEDIVGEIEKEMVVNLEDAVEKELAKSRIEEYLFSGSYVVAKDGKIIARKAFGFINKKCDKKWCKDNMLDTQVFIGSNTKQFTANVIMELKKEGKLKLTDSITEHLKWYTPKELEVSNVRQVCDVSSMTLTVPNKGQITIQQLLEMSSGLPVTGIPSTHKPFNVEKYIGSNCSSSSLCYNPGARGSDNNCNYFILGAIIAEVLAKDPDPELQAACNSETNTNTDWRLNCYDKALSKYVFKKHNMVNSGYLGDPKNLACGYIMAADITPSESCNPTQECPECPDRKIIRKSARYAFSAGGIFSNLGDLLIWGDYLNSELKNKNLSDEGLIESMAKARVLYGGVISRFWNPVYGGYGLVSRFYSPNYEYYVESGQEETTFIVQQGGALPPYLTLFAIIPDQGYTIIVTNNSNNWITPYNFIANEIAEVIIRVLLKPY